MRKTRGVVSKRLMLQIEPIAFLEDNTPIYPIMGSEDDPQEEGAGDEGEEDGEEDEDDSDEEKSKPKRRKPKETDAQFRRRLNKEAQIQRERAEAAEAKIREAEDKDKTELEIAKRDLAELQVKYAKLPEQMDNLRIENAFLKLKGYNWHDPDDAIDKIRKDVAIMEDGTVDGLEDAVKALAKSKPYLLKKKDGEEEGDGKSGATRRPPRGPSGATLSGPKSPRGDTKAQRAQELAQKYKIF